jgi:hypothetical protein
MARNETDWLGTCFVRKLPHPQFLHRASGVGLFLVAACLGFSQTAQKYTDLHGFGGGVINANGKGGSDGNMASGGVTVDFAGDRAGTSRAGGHYGFGMLWEIQQSGTYKDVHDFGGVVINANGQSGPDGKNPYAALTFDSAGDMFGTAYEGGPNFGTHGGPGMIWEITKAGTYIDLHDFGGTVLNASGLSGPDGASPYAGVTLDSAGDLFGTTTQGGANGHGMIWEITNMGIYEDLHDFGGTILKADGKNGPDGLAPYGGVSFDVTGNMFGTTSAGGAYGGNVLHDTGGIVWEITKAGVYRDLYDFGGVYAKVFDGYSSFAGVTVDGAGNKFGTTSQGGANMGGMVWELSNVGTYKDLHDFGGTVLNYSAQSGLDGLSPSAGVTFNTSGDMFGTATAGGANNEGIVWEITKAGTYRDFHDFGGTASNVIGSIGPDGASPVAGVAIDGAGDLLGTTNAGGNCNNGGILWKLTTTTVMISPVSFIDTFQQGNSWLGTLGIAPDGQPFTMLGAYVNTFPLPAATDGAIVNHMFVSTQDPTVIYACKNFDLPVHHMSSTFQWSKTASHPSTETGAMIISPNSDLIDTMIHVTFNSEQVQLQKRNLAVSGDPFVTLITVPVRQLDGKSHSVSLDIVGTTATLTVDGVAQSYTDADFPSLVGPYVVWEIYSATSNVYPIQYTGVAASS